MKQKAFGNLFTDAHRRIQSCIGLLKDHRNAFAAETLHVGLGLLKKVYAGHFTLFVQVNNHFAAFDDAGFITQSQVRAAAQGLGPDEMDAFSAAVHWAATGMRSIFIQDANSLIMKPAELVEVLTHLKQCFPWVARYCPDVGDGTVPILSRPRYREILRHIWLRGADAMQIFNAHRKDRPEIATELLGLLEAKVAKDKDGKPSHWSTTTKRQFCMLNEVGAWITRSNSSRISASLIRCSGSKCFTARRA